MTTKAATVKKNAYERIAESFIEMLNNGVSPWNRPWKTSGGHPMNFVSRRRYSGVNWFLLLQLPTSTPFWLTYKQAKELGGNVRKGQHGQTVVYWNMLDKKDPETKEPVLKDGKAVKLPFLKTYTVFNLDQTEGIKFPPEVKEDLKQIDFEPIEACKQVVDEWEDCPEIEHGGGRACYSPTGDVIRMPDPDTFKSAEYYYSTLFHEMGHATGHEDRLKRDMSGHFGSYDYGKEELVAEMTSAFLCAETHIDNPVRECTAAYFDNWIKAIKGDPKMLVQAAGQAQKAANYILGRTDKQDLHD